MNRRMRRRTTGTGMIALSALALHPDTLCQTAAPAATALRSPLPIDAHIAEAAQRFGLPEGWISAVIAQESSGNAAALSAAGAMGLMQIMPATWAELRARYRLGDDPYAPRDNILAGTAYLRELHDRYGPAGMLAAYNAGPGRYEAYLKEGRPLPAETRAYLTRLLPMIGRGGAREEGIQSAPPFVAWTHASLFPARASDSGKIDDRGTIAARDAAGASSNRTGSSLFISRSGGEK